MRQEQIELYKDIAFEIAKEENLIPKYNIDIIFRSPAQGYIRRGGTCQRNKLLRTAKLLIYTTEAQFFLNPTGKYKDKEGNKYVRGVGKNMSLRKIREILCHELAHVKHINHGREHSAYTDYIVKKFDEKIVQYNPVEAALIIQDNIKNQRDS